MEKKIYFKISAIIILCFTYMLNLQAQYPIQNWSVESSSSKLNIIQKEDTLEVFAFDGLTLWYNKKLTGDYQITYKAKVIMKEGPNDRLSDLNCFWGANDPKHPDDIFAQAAWRRGLFKRYNTLDLYYVGYGGNNNTTTRFRRYYSKYYGKDNENLRPVIKEYTDKNHLLKPNTWYEITIIVKGNKTLYKVNNELLFEREITKGECDGYFGLRMWKNHTIFTNFRITNLAL